MSHWFTVTQYCFLLCCIIGPQSIPWFLDVSRFTENMSMAGISLIISIYLPKGKVINSKERMHFQLYFSGVFLVYIRNLSLIQAHITCLFPTAFQLYFILSCTKAGCPSLLVMLKHRFHMYSRSPIQEY